MIPLPAPPYPPLEAWDAELVAAWNGDTPPTQQWRVVLATEPGADPRHSMTPNHFIRALGGACLVEGLTPHLVEHCRAWYAFQEATLMGKTWRRAEALSGIYRGSYVGPDCAIYKAATRDGNEEIAQRALMDLRRHAAIIHLLRVPGAWPPRSLSLGARCRTPADESPCMLACVLAGLPPEEWGKLKIDSGVSGVSYPIGYQGGKPSRALARNVGVLMLREIAFGPPLLLYDEGHPPAMRDIIAEIRATGLRLPWPLLWTGDGETWFDAWFSGRFPDGAEEKGGLIHEVVAKNGYAAEMLAREVPEDAQIGPWWFTVGPTGLTMHREPAGQPSPPVEPDPLGPDIWPTLPTDPCAGLRAAMKEADEILAAELERAIESRDGSGGGRVRIGKVREVRRLLRKAVKG